MPQIRVPHAHRLLKESIRESEINRRREKKQKKRMLDVALVTGQKYHPERVPRFFFRV